MSSDFALSRIYAEGWAAAGKLTAVESAVLEAQGVAALNPYSDERERARWAEGFGRALGEDAPRRAGTSARWSRRP